MSVRSRALRLLSSALLLAAICACGRGGSNEEAPSAQPTAPAPAVQPSAPSGPVTLPDAIMPLTEGGQVEPREPDVSTVTARFPNGQFDALRTRVREWMPANGWTLVEGSETDSERTASSLEALGMREAAELARRTPSFGASYQRAGQTVAVNIDSLDGTLSMRLNWF
jgi:hypothetical protein